MTCDAVGGIWPYAAGLAAALEASGIEVTLLGTGPAPSPAAAAALPRPPRWLDLPPSWLAATPDEARALAGRIAAVGREIGADLLHLNQPGEAAFLETSLPVVVAAHSCLATWWQGVLGLRSLRCEWRWRARIEADGFRRAAAVGAPTASHAAAVAAVHGIATPAVVPNAATAPAAGPGPRTRAVVAAARWWDAGKNLETLDRAAAACPWPVLLFGGLRGPDGSTVSPRHARPLGPRPADEVHHAMRHAALFVSPSLYEPFGLAALEAARSGAALVLADIPSYREIWDGAARLLRPPRPRRAGARARRPRPRRRRARPPRRGGHSTGRRLHPGPAGGGTRPSLRRRRGRPARPAS